MLFEGEHATLAPLLYVTDNKAINGTWVKRSDCPEEMRIVPRDGAKLLNDADYIKLGDNIYCVLHHEGPENRRHFQLTEIQEAQSQAREIMSSYQFIYC